MDTTVLVALITGLITAASTLGATALTAYRNAKVERWRAEHTLARERERREYERDRTRAREVRDRLEAVRGSVLRLDLSMRYIAQIRAHGPPKQGGNDLPEQVRQARTHLYEAVIAVERMRDVLPPTARTGSTTCATRWTRCSTTSRRGRDGASSRCTASS